MKLKFVSIKNAVLDFIEDSGITTESEATLLKWAHDITKTLSIDTQLAHRIRVIPIHNGSVQLPEDFRILTQAAARIFPKTDCDCKLRPNDPCCSRQGRAQQPGHGSTRMEKVVEWTLDTFEEDCDITIDVSCPNCKQPGTACSCSDKVMEVNVDRIWELSHPEYYYQHFSRAFRVGEGNTMYSYYHPDFQILTYSQSNMHRIGNILPGCVNTQCRTCTHKFSIDDSHMYFDFEEGELLLSYLGDHLDEFGDLMIPDHPYVTATVTYYLTYKHFLKEYLSGKDTARARYITAKQEYQESISSATSLLSVPDFHEFKSWVESNWFQRIQKTSLDYNSGNVDVAKGYMKAIDGNTGIDLRGLPTMDFRL